MLERPNYLDINTPDALTTPPMEPNDAGKEARARASELSRISSLLLHKDDCDAMLKDPGLVLPIWKCWRNVCVVWTS
jgi:hypothetical protein